LQIKLDGQGLIDWELWCVDGANVRATRAAAASFDQIRHDKTPIGALIPGESLSCVPVDVQSDVQTGVC
jgi:hypothetical protein